MSSIVRGPTNGNKLRRAALAALAELRAREAELLAELAASEEDEPAADRYVDLDELERRGLSRRVVCAAIRRSEVAAVRLGRRRLVAESELARWLGTRCARVPPATPPANDDVSPVDPAPPMDDVDALVAERAASMSRRRSRGA